MKRQNFVYPQADGRYSESACGNFGGGVTMDDLISRQSAKDAIDEYMVGKNCAADGTMMARLINEIVIDRLPSAEPKRGKWVDDGDPLMLTCGNCGYAVMRYNNTPFCPNCGADMRGE